MKRFLRTLWRDPPRHPAWFGWMYVVIGLVFVVPRALGWGEHDGLSNAGITVGVAQIALGFGFLLRARAPAPALLLHRTAVLVAAAGSILLVAAVFDRV